MTPAKVHAVVSALTAIYGEAFEGLQQGIAALQQALKAAQASAARVPELEKRCVELEAKCGETEKALIEVAAQRDDLIHTLAKMRESRG